MGISVEFSHHEGGPGQQEIDLRYADALTTADNIMTFRVVIKEVALSQGIHASFMPKPFTEFPGQRCTRTCPVRGRPQRLLRGGLGVPPVEDGPSVHRRAARTTPPRSRPSPTSGSTPTSGLPGGGEAPSYVCWGHNNRSALVRVPMYKPTKGAVDPGRAAVDRHCGQPVPRVRRHACGGDEGDRGELRAACAVPRTTCGA